MVFSSTVFLFLFLPLVLILYYSGLFKAVRSKNVLLLIASLLFYAWGEPLFVLVMMASIGLNWLLVLWMARAKRKRCVLTLILAYDIGLLFVFKYLGFAVNDILAPLFSLDIGIVSIALPIGISFFTFQMISYVLDVYFGRSRPQKNILTVALYISLFPQLIAGPIVRYNSIETMLTQRSVNTEDFAAGAKRFIIGLAKKVLLANYVAVVADNIFGASVSLAAGTAWLGVTAYALQIYFDFSGYSDMAIGLGRMFGFHFEENFNHPYIARSITDFWRRWHISLSTWFRDYVYIPLGGNRAGKARQSLNLFVVWLLTGIWHGANWTFLLWGLVFFVVLILEKNIRIRHRFAVLPHLYALFIVLCNWVLFRSDTVGDAMQYLKSMFLLNGNAAFDPIFFNQLRASWLVLLIAVIACLPLKPLAARLGGRLKIDRLAPVLEASATLVLLVFSVVCCIANTYNPFIYFNF